MKLFKSVLSIGVFIFCMFFLIQCQQEIFTPDDLGLQSFEMKAKPGTVETVGNNLSYPVIWADNVAKDLNGNMGDHNVSGEWWFVWGEDPIDPQAEIFSCKPDASGEFCEDGSQPGDGLSTVYKAYVQKDALNEWQATSILPEAQVFVDSIDWGDNLESIDWGLKSKVRTEVVLLKDLKDPVTEYAMRHVSGWGTDEVHGQQTDNGEPVFGPGTRATVYSDNARFTIQKLIPESLEGLEGSLIWDEENNWWTEVNPAEDIVNDPIFTDAVGAEDGPDFYNAEVNVKGKIIYGYTWNVKDLNQGLGYYRLTFSFDNHANLNTFFNEETGIIGQNVIVIAAEEEESGGGVANVVPESNLTYMDVLIKENDRGNGGGGKGKPGSGGGNNGGGRGGNGMH